MIFVCIKVFSLSLSLFLLMPVQNFVTTLCSLNSAIEINKLKLKCSSISKEEKEGKLFPLLFLMAEVMNGLKAVDVFTASEKINKCISFSG